MFQSSVGRGFLNFLNHTYLLRTKLNCDQEKPVPSQKAVAKQFKSILASNINITQNKNLINYLDGLQNVN